jgi:signal transduction histidine kinase
VLNDDGDRAGSEPAGKRHPLPDIADLDTLVEQVRAAGQAVDFSVDGQPAALATDAQLAVYRLVQEALTNTMKHAPAGARAAVALSYGSHSLELRIDDDGAGEPSVDRWRAGRGVSGMRARVQALGGQLETGPRPGSGWRVTARLPLDDTERTLLDGAGSR